MNLYEPSEAGRRQRARSKATTTWSQFGTAFQGKYSSTHGDTVNTCKGERDRVRDAGYYHQQQHTKRARVFFVVERVLERPPCDERVRWWMIEWDFGNAAPNLSFMPA